MTLKTKICSLMLVDLNLTGEALPQVIVVQGLMEVGYDHTRKLGVNGEKVILDTTVFTKELEIFSATVSSGELVVSPVQIVEPTNFTVFYRKERSLNATDEEAIECKLVADPINCQFSFQNFALVNAILLSSKGVGAVKGGEVGGGQV